MASGWAVGLMTGTVLDGNIDIAMLRTDGERIEEFGPFELVPYEQDLRPLLRETMQDARDWNFTGPEPEIFARAEKAVSEAQADAVVNFLERHSFKAEDIAAVGFHGQTVLHRAPDGTQKGATRQLGDGALMAEIVGTSVGFDFRSQDVAAGGQGAPLAPIYHRAMLERVGLLEQAAILNLGGVGNLTFCEGDTMIAFDTGPANAPVNDWVRDHLGYEMDRDGATAATGRVDETRLARLLSHPYLTKAYPKSLDRFDFMSSMADGLSVADGAATLTAFSAGCVAKGLALLPHKPSKIVVCGGGRRNPVLMKEIKTRAGVEVLDADTLGLRGDAVEAECFAYLAMRTLRGLPISFPEATGAPRPMTGGRVARPAKGT
ncbi:anhydro-N-acetylmuramic acid kinase [Roseibium sp. TrichSKD4]|uniref:anhydro-N-acetylmuramic acid kinase n=1 Tax=Roseibium sp. TrichSKD4 TaxID=744980 RepID=UPI0001E56A55|nr:anhydro-N-acetylmuramic acid kinase [Roseibium sp. TrichSKD4]EFO32540.1 anhydro-N-acetylmuramic acid kinase [Roseibium sp. TrichSKD4]